VKKILRGISLLSRKKSQSLQKTPSESVGASSSYHPLHSSFTAYRLEELARKETSIPVLSFFLEQ